METQDAIGILIVDDNPAKLQALKAVVADMGLDVVTAGSGEEALRHLLMRDFALVVLDVNMPGMDGFETAQMIRARPRSEHTPIVFVSALHTSEADRLQGYNLGAVDYLFSPILPTILRSRVGVFADLYRMRRMLESRVIQSERRAHEITLLGRLARNLLLCETGEEAHRVIQRLLPQLFPHAAGVLAVFDARRAVLEPIAAWGDPLPPAKPFGAEDCWTLRQGKKHLVDRTHRNPRCAHSGQSTATGAAACVPLVADGETLGVFHWQCGAAAMARHEAQLVEAVAEQLALTLSNLALRERMRLQALTDPLTGLDNRRSMDEKLHHEIRRAQRSGKPLAVIMLDIDHFKRLNDTYGHDAGDAVLRAVGGLIGSHVRGSGADSACRYGGEEFILLLPEITPDIALTRAESLRREMEQVEVRCRGEALPVVTVSLGVALFPEHAADAAAVLKAADQALYRAKQEGRNRVVMAEPAGR